MDTENLSEHERKNLALWESQSEAYQRDHMQDLSTERVEAWGVWRVPERELQALGEVRDRDILEFGCGGAQWSVALAKRGARPVGLDVSASQLEHARRLMHDEGMSFPLILASGENVPLPDSQFDLVFCDWGAMTFCDPERTVPEVARLLRPGGSFVFLTHSPLSMLCMDMKSDRHLEMLVNEYWDMKRFEWEDEVNFQLPYGDWIRLFRRNGFVVEDLIEPRPTDGATSSYRTQEDYLWARRWPMESLWRLRKQGSERHDKA